MQAARSELEQEWLERLTELDQERCQAACSSIQESTAHIKTTARLELAKRLGDPDSISALTEPKLEPLVSADA